MYISSWKRVVTLLLGLSVSSSALATHVKKLRDHDGNVILLP